MIEKNAVAGIHAVGFAIVYRDPVGVQLGTGIGRTGIKRRLFRLGRLLHFAEQFGSGSLVEAGFCPKPKHPDSFEQAQGSQCVHIGRILGRFKRNLHMALRRQVVDLIGLHFLHDPDQAAGIGEIPIMQHEFAALLMRSLVEMINAVGVEKRRTALYAVYFISLVEQEFSQIGAVLSGDAGDKRFFHSFPRSSA